MEIRFVLQTVFEIAVAGFIIYGLFFEHRFAQTERRVFRFLRHKLREVFLSDGKAGSDHA